MTTPGGLGATQGSFSVTSPVAPALSQVAPAAAGPGATVTLTGSGLTTVNQVTFNGVPAAGLHHGQRRHPHRRGPLPAPVPGPSP